MIRKAVLAIVFGILWATTASGQYCNSHVSYPVVTPYVATNYQPTVIVKEKIVPVEVYTPVLVPTFAVSYVPPPPPAPPAPPPAPPPPPAVQGVSVQQFDKLLVMLDKISARQDAMEARLAAMVRTPPPLPPPLKGGNEQGSNPPPAQELTRAQVFKTKCAACHTQGSLAKDVTLALVDAKGNALELTPPQLLDVTTRVHKGEMPPAYNKFLINPCSDQEYAAILLGRVGGK